MEQRFININLRQGIRLWSYLYMCKYRWRGGRGAENTQRPCYRNRPVHVYSCSGSKAFSHIRPPGSMWWAECSEESHICMMPISSKVWQKTNAFQAHNYCNMRIIYHSILIQWNYHRKCAIFTLFIAHLVLTLWHYLSISQMRTLRILK